MTAETKPTIRKRLSGISRAADMARLALIGNAANSMPSIAKNKPIAARKSNIEVQIRSIYLAVGGTEDVDACGLGAARDGGGAWPDGSPK
jgi:hypothetical protein